MPQSFRLSCSTQRVLGSAIWLSAVTLLALTQCAIRLYAQTTMAEQLQRVLEPLATAHTGDVAISVRVLDEANNVTCQWHYHGQRAMPTASLIKLSVMLEANV